MKLQITDIEFDIDLTDDFGEKIDTELLKNKLYDIYIGQFFDVDEEGELADLISDKSGWCVSDIAYNIASYN